MGVGHRLCAMSCDVKPSLYKYEIDLTGENERSFGKTRKLFGVVFFFNCKH